MAMYPDDTLLFQAFQQGETDAEKIVFHRFFKAVCLYAERITGEQITTEDIVIESFQKTWERRAIFPTLDDFRRYLYRIVYNASLTAADSRRLHEVHHSRIRQLRSGEFAEDDAEEREMLRAELLQEIYLEIEGLPDRCRTIFKLIFFQHLTIEQIAQQLGLNAQTVRTQKARAIGLIRFRLLRKGHVLAIFLLYSLLDRL
jgi:RNA polymerase sigma factor (sigma-70 family)